MAKTTIEDKLIKYRAHKLYNLLSAEEQQFIEKLTSEFRLTFQEFRQLCEYSRDLNMWGEPDLQNWWIHFQRFQGSYKSLPQAKTHFLNSLHEHMQSLKIAAKSYNEEEPNKPVKPEKNQVISEKTDANIYGWCPVASEKTVCCNLRTIDAVESCAFGCSYCTIQTFYRDKIIIENNLAEKLQNLDLDKNRRYHIGTGQSSDALVWGNRNGILDDLCVFAKENPNVLLEFKTKSDNISYFLENEIPANIVCSWSLNPQIIIDNEEHYTASLQKRLSAARAVADRGIKVSFHFHPIIYYDDWQTAYPEIANTILEKFKPEEILFISFGSVTFIKPVIKKIRERGLPTRILQMDFATDPHGKLTYSDEIKINKFSLMYETFKPWHDKVFFYLCMEKASLWEKSFGYVYKTNEEFEQALIESSFSKIKFN